MFEKRAICDFWVTKRSWFIPFFKLTQYVPIIVLSPNEQYKRFFDFCRDDQEHRYDKKTSMISWVLRFLIKFLVVPQNLCERVHYSDYLKDSDAVSRAIFYKKRRCLHFWLARAKGWQFNARLFMRYESVDLARRSLRNEHSTCITFHLICHKTMLGMFQIFSML